MPWEQDFNVVEEAMETLQETHGSSHPIISRDDGAGPSSIPQTPSNELQLELQAERAEREALARQVRRLKDELDHVKGLVAAVLESSPNIQQNQAAPHKTSPHPHPHKTSPNPHQTSPNPHPHQTSPNPHQTSPNPHQTSPNPHPHQTSPNPHQTSPNPHQTSPNPHPHQNQPHPHQTSPHPHPHKTSPHPYPHTASPHPHKASCPFKPPLWTCQVHRPRLPREAKLPKRRPRWRWWTDKLTIKADNAGEAAAAIVDLWVDAHFLYQPTAADEAVLADFRKKWGGPKRRGTRKRPNEVDSNEMAISTDTYELTGRDVSSLLADQAQDESSRWISTATTILGMAPSTSTQRGKRTRKGKQPIQDDQPQPQAVFRPSWVRSMPTNCNRSHRALAPTLVNTCFEISIFLLTQYYIPLILLFAACIIEKSFGADMQGELEAYGCPYMAPTIQG
uniref:Uncharacterized protein n=1 Tax=Fagus sylvatica TaxID=28930 RepID=A0A2N9I4N2_FAGSY